MNNIFTISSWQHSKKIVIMQMGYNSNVSCCFYLFQRSQVLGNKTEMEITSLIEKNPTILRLGLHLEYNDARHRIATHLQRNIDTSKYVKDLCRYITTKGFHSFIFYIIYLYRNFYRVLLIISFNN